MTQRGSEHSEIFHDPLAVPIGIQAGGDALPSSGWPETYDEETVDRIIAYLPATEVEVDELITRFKSE